MKYLIFLVCLISFGCGLSTEKKEVSSGDIAPYRTFEGKMDVKDGKMELQTMDRTYTIRLPEGMSGHLEVFSGRQVEVKGTYREIDSNYEIDVKSIKDMK
jgi:hypothetical protein